MIPVMCITQAGQLTVDQATQLKAQISAFCYRAFAAEAAIDWIEVAPGNGFTAGAPSTSVVVSMHANQSLSQDLRRDLLRGLGRICEQATGRSPSEIVTSIRDPKS